VKSDPQVRDPTSVAHGAGRSSTAGSPSDTTPWRASCAAAGSEVGTTDNPQIIAPAEMTAVILWANSDMSEISCGGTIASCSVADQKVASSSNESIAAASAAKAATARHNSVLAVKVTMRPQAIAAPQDWV
jgi:hypothetical protein